MTPISHSPVPVFLGSAAACLVLAACSGDGGPAASWTGTVDTLPSGAVLVSNPAEGIWSEEERWTLSETLRIGSMADEGPELFGQIVDVEVDDQGRILVLEGQAHELRIFDADGQHLITMGGPGEGPGELNVGFGGEVFSRAGQIWVNNMFNRRWELFSYEGEAIESTPNPSTFFGAGSVLGDDGAFYLRGRVGEGEEARDAMFRLDVQGDSLVRTDTIFTPELEDHGLHEQQREPDGDDASGPLRTPPDLHPRPGGVLLGGRGRRVSPCSAQSGW